MRDLTPFSADDLALMRWTLTTVQANVDRRVKSRLFSSVELEEEAPKLAVALNHFDQGYLEDPDVVVLLAAFYTMEELYPRMQRLGTGPRPLPSQDRLKMVFEQVRRLPYLELVEA